MSAPTEARVEPMAASVLDYDYSNFFYHANDDPVAIL